MKETVSLIDLYTMLTYAKDMAAYSPDIDEREMAQKDVKKIKAKIARYKKNSILDSVQVRC